MRLLQLKPAESGSGHGEAPVPRGAEKTKYITQQQSAASVAAAAGPALSFAFNICPPSPESSPTRRYLPGINTPFNRTFVSQISPHLTSS